VHSVETCGTVDGPGIRFVLFTNGCPLRCRYCHNPDTQSLKSGRLTTVAEVMAQVSKYKAFLRRGGMTISGGEPLCQQRFVESLLREAKRMGLHTALDTSGCFGTQLRPAILEHVDLVLLDLKTWSNERHRKLTGYSMEPVLDFARHLASIRKPVWVRFVLVPTLTDDPAIWEGIGSFAASLSNVELLEVLPFHQYGASKYERMQRPYPLKDTPEPSEALMEQARAAFRSFGLKVR
jgi:pyruvate formate lyase activating enzyme